MQSRRKDQEEKKRKNKKDKTSMHA